jgi:hypothetical protein
MRNCNLSRWIGVIALGISLSPISAHAQSLRDQLLGAWELVSWTQMANGSEEPGPLGKDVVGMIVYAPDGHMCATAMIPNRRLLSTTDFRAAPDEEKARAFESFFGYCGRFEVNETDAFVTHTVSVGSVPNFTGSKQRRFVNISGDELTLSTPKQKIGEREVVGLIRWRRAR